MFYAIGIYWQMLSVPGSSSIMGGYRGGIGGRERGRDTKGSIMPYLPTESGTGSKSRPNIISPGSDSCFALENISFHIVRFSCVNRVFSGIIARGISCTFKITITLYCSDHFWKLPIHWSIKFLLNLIVLRKIMQPC